MLEHSGLLLNPWNFPEAAKEQRTIVEPQSGTYLGHAEREKRAGSFSWLRGDKVKVFETEDASLLMTLSKPWALSRTWQVHDADDRRVGLLYRDRLWDPKGMPLAQVHEPQVDRAGRFVDADGRELATFERRTPNGILLTFSEFLHRDPFAKMAILGSVLLWNGV